ncbi:MAG: hypothetical protein JWN99_212 [Ilumatobacteraceae bacterium]|jgi:hypothetical protein|nr:hypothetical protein [Ilumatobacteraceae bacterium]
MVRLLRRIVLASLLVGGIAFVVQRRRGHLPAAATHASGAHTSSAAWPPIASDDEPPASVTRTTADRSSDVRSFVEVAPTESDGRARWVEPNDGQCPDGYPIKANDNSGIFHVPGGRFYDRTVPERCYADAQAAAADGYRAAKA